jgi:hypothetical protein
MEDVLEVFHRPPDPLRPLVCLDEFCKQLVAEVALPIPPAPGKEGAKGRPKRYDAEYVRQGSASAFMMAMPHLGRREVFFGKEGRRTALDYADAIKFICDEVFPHAEKIVLVQDNLNIHEIASLYKRFPPQEARRLTERLELHYTPKHGSWLNIAEIEISVLSRARPKRIGDLDTYRRYVAAETKRRNENPTPVKWQFTIGDARIKLKRLYPSI